LKYYYETKKILQEPPFGGEGKCDMKSAGSCLIGGIQKFSVEDGPGIRTTVFLKGCPLYCARCHHPELIEYAQQILFNTSKCVGCGVCLTICPRNTIGADDQRMRVIEEAFNTKGIHASIMGNNIQQ
jgi:pyruvate-formate lyase-activating enzyme